MSDENIQSEPKEARNTETPTQPTETRKSLSELQKLIKESLRTSTILNEVEDAPYLELVPFDFGRGIVDSAGNLIGAAQIRRPEISGSGEALNIVTIPAKLSEELSAKTAEILREAALAYERIGKDQQEIEQLKMETRALLAGLRAA